VSGKRKGRKQKEKAERKRKARHQWWNVAAKPSEQRAEPANDEQHHWVAAGEPEPVRQQAGGQPALCGPTTVAHSDERGQSGAQQQRANWLRAGQFAGGPSEPTGSGKWQQRDGA